MVASPVYRENPQLSVCRARTSARGGRHWPQWQNWKSRKMLLYPHPHFPAPRKLRQRGHCLPRVPQGGRVLTHSLGLRPAVLVPRWPYGVKASTAQLTQVRFPQGCVLAPGVLGWERGACSGAAQAPWRLLSKSIPILVLWLLSGFKRSRQRDIPPPTASVAPRVP